jgi:hypothetical protein
MLPPDTAIAAALGVAGRPVAIWPTTSRSAWGPARLARAWWAGTTVVGAARSAGPRWA